ncbi:peptide/nickel transport system substrate-binding protein [Microlunatus panaciterrae]|uniref:Peptide/nickel transport system substrate-binding protein n=3 Tax=Microlunatus panaciterrae TaxID=400768 RepID=A0ABS2RKQ4_9ACTN|nr:ABC transporter substrate-binding protein [Microlunatus panaciterrae]MBM7799588.1 peptide/nickel transport system substrate-binding protein [Microlunatus panaciterrae]
MTATELGTRTGWETSRRRFLSISGLALGGAAVGLGAAGCGTAKTGNDVNGAAKGRPGAAGETLFVSGFQWGPPTNFNPVGPSPAWPTGGGSIQLIYETLVRFNMVDGSLQPGLGTELKENDGGKSFTVALQEGTKWSDGKDLTADDVVFTFEIAKDASLSYSNVWEYLESVSATDPRTVEFKVKAKPFNPLPVKNAIAGTYIIPKHIWEEFATAKTLAKQANTKPVGSGPFLLDKYDQTQITLKRRDDYWGKAIFGTPAMTAVVHPVFKTGNDGDIKLQSGDIDASQQFTPQIWKMWEDKKKPIHTWLKEKPYYLPGNIPLLQINQTVKGLDNPKVRQAIAYAIDTPNIASTAMSDYSEPANASLILPTGFEEAFYDKDAVAKDGWTFDKNKAVEILEKELKAKKGSDGIYKLPDGTRLGPWTLITPTGWTDWNTACEIVAKSCQAVGIDVKTEFPQAPNVTSKMQNGDFQLACWSASGVSPASPWSRFRDLLDDRGAAPVGKTTFYNFTRFKHPDVPKLLDDAGAATTDDERKTIYQKLDAIYRQTIPVVPLMYRPLEFYEFNESNWTGFPTEANPYAPPMWQGAGITWLFKIKKVGT